MDDMVFSSCAYFDCTVLWAKRESFQKGQGQNAGRSMLGISSLPEA
ncbi:MAG: hypothetical protein ACI4O7_09345 [Aristaeellaceae bacterium]